MVQVEIALYDLLPPGKLSTTFYYLGVGIYHTSVRIPELQVEFAYGGIFPGSHLDRDVSKVTGIFVLPSPDDPRVAERLMPGLRFVRRIDVGEAFGVDWLKNVKSGRRVGRLDSTHKPLPPLPDSVIKQNKRRQRYKNNLSSSSSSGNLPLLHYNDSPQYSEDQSFSSMAGTDEWGRKLSSPPAISTRHSLDPLDGPLASSPASYAPPDVSPFRDYSASPTTSSSLPTPNTTSFPSTSANQQPSSTASDLADILAVVEDLKTEPEWRAARYNLLLKNCNNFTSELCFRLTGRQAPTWTNRAAWLAQSLPCLVPDGWLDPPTADDQQETTPAARDANERASELDRPTSPLIAVPYVHTSPMHVDVHYEAVQAQ